MFFGILYLRKVLMVYFKKWRTESGSQIELARRCPRNSKYIVLSQ